MAVKTNKKPTKPSKPAPKAKPEQQATPPAATQQAEQPAQQQQQQAPVQQQPVQKPVQEIEVRRTADAAGLASPRPQAQASGSGLVISGEFTADDLILPVVNCYQGTTIEKKKSWFNDDLRNGDLVLSNGVVFNGKYDRAAKTGENRFAVLRLDKKYIVYRPRDNSGDDNTPVIEATTAEELKANLTAELLADHGWVEGEEFDPKAGTYLAEQLETPTEWVETIDPDAPNIPPLAITSLEAMILCEDGQVARLRLSSRRDSEKVQKEFYTACMQSSLSPIPYMFIANSQVRTSKLDGDQQWNGIKVTMAGLAPAEFSDLYKIWVRRAESVKTRDME